ncbi:MAG: hypothetical protein ACLTDX_08740 [[Clostridium] innocuum]
MRRIHKGIEEEAGTAEKQDALATGDEAGDHQKTRLCMLIMAGIFFLLIPIQSGLYVCVPQRYQGSILHMVQWGKWGLLAGEVIIYAVLKDSEMEGV